MPVPSTARSVGPKPPGSLLRQALDNMPVYTDGEETYDGSYTSGTYWLQVMDFTNHVPAAIAYAQKRNVGRRFVWEHDDIGVRIWRTA